MNETGAEVVELKDPETGGIFFINTQSGALYNEPPTDAKIATKNPDVDEWWELRDPNHKLTRKTVWVRPTSGIIIPNLSIPGKKSRDLNALPRNSTVSITMPSISTTPQTSSPRTSISKLANMFNKPSVAIPANHTVDIRAIPISSPILNPEAAAAMNPFSKENTAKTKQLSVSDPLSPQFPADLKKEIGQFKIDGYAQKYFTTQRRGLFRRKVPMQKMLEYQKDTIPGPLLNLAPSLHKDAVKTFKLLQKILTAKGEMISSHDDIEQLIEKGIRTGSLRDEILVQSIKQLTNNPKTYLPTNQRNQIQRGWQLLSVLCSAFPPSKNLEMYLKNFIQTNFEMDGKGSFLDTVIKFSMSQLNRTCKTGPRGRTMTKQAPFQNSVFGDSLSRIMERQQNESSEKVPIVLKKLIESILKLDGQKSEGIFRVPGDAERVADLRCRIDKNDYDFSYLTDPNIPSSLLKLWLRELSEPLIPSEFYPLCIMIGQNLDDKSQEKACFAEAKQLLARLPEVNFHVVNTTIEFLSKIAETQNAPFTRMSAANIAMVFAPNFLRCPVDDPVVIFENTKFEQAFLRILITGGQ